MLLSLQGIRKRFGGVVALDGVDFQLAAGEIHALLGENGAGKSTLIKVLGGIHQPDAGSISIDGQPVRLEGIQHAGRLGIQLIHQELALAPNLSIADNLFLGRELTRRGFLDRARMGVEAARVIADLGFGELPEVSTQIGRLSLAQCQLVEIARALSQRARILVLDEPTASLSESETASLFKHLAKLRAEGVGLIYISHRLEEIARLADRVTVLRDGRSVGTQPASALDRSDLVRWMVGRELKDHYPRPRNTPGEAVLEVSNLHGPGVNGVGFSVRAGEILGFAGLVGAGRTELARVLFGLAPRFSGEVRIQGRPVALDTPAAALAAGLVMVPEDRKREGLVMGRSVEFNATLPWTRDWMRGCQPDRARQQSICDRIIDRFHIKTADRDIVVSALSGGNQQKVVVGRWTEQPPKVLILDEPTRGVDVGAREEMFHMIHQLAAEGMAVILISSDLPEVMALSHRLALYRGGRILREAAAGELSAEQIMAELAGAREVCA